MLTNPSPTTLDSRFTCAISMVQQVFYFRSVLLPPADKFGVETHRQGESTRHRQPTSSQFGIAIRTLLDASER